MSQRRAWGLLLLAIGVSGLLLACQMKQPRLASKMPPWGNYKCVSVSSTGERYTGWSVYKSEAKENALAMCHEATKEEGCKIDSCKNKAVKEKKKESKS